MILTFKSSYFDSIIFFLFIPKNVLLTPGGLGGGWKKDFTSSKFNSFLCHLFSNNLFKLLLLL